MENKTKLNKYEIEHLYELALENFQESCYECEKLKKKLEKHMTPDTIEYIKLAVKEHPYRERHI